jgi:hypothetical protein
MPDVFLRSGEASPSDVRLYGPGIVATVATAFGFSTAATATQTDTATIAVAFGFSTAATATVTASEPTTFCDYDFADDTYDNPADTYDCGAVAPTVTPSSAKPVRRLPIVIPRPKTIEARVAVSFGFSTSATAFVRSDEGWLLGLFLTEDDLALVR